MKLLSDASTALWLMADAADASDPFDVISLGPSGFAAYARVNYVGQFLPNGDPLPEIDQTRSVVDVLSRFTSTPDEFYFCVWTGYEGSFLRSDLAAQAAVKLPHREFVLFEGSPTDLAQWGELFDSQGFEPPPAFLWPADRAWCFTSDVDPDWAGIGASQQAVDALVRREDLAVVQTPRPL